MTNKLGRTFIAVVVMVSFFCGGIVCKAANNDTGYEDASLSSLSLSSGTLSPTFNADTTSYTAEAGDDINETVIPIAADASASITVNGTSCASGSCCKVNLSLSTCVITIIVTTQNGSSKSYSVVVSRQSTANVGLSSLALSSGSLSPAFATDTLTYSTSVANSVTTLTLIPTSLDTAQTITVNNVAVTSGCGYSLPLSVGTNTAVILVSLFGSYTTTYTVTVIRATSTSVGLSSLMISSGSLSPNFATATLAYSASVTNNVTSVTLTPIVLDTTQTIMVNNTTVVNGYGYSLPLSVGTNTALITVSASDGTSKTYTVTITRTSASSSVGLSSLAISSGSLSPTFATSTLAYSASVANSVTSVTLTPAALDTTQTITVNNTAVVSGCVFCLPLSVGSNFAVITVSLSGGTSKTYTVTITRTSASSSVGLSNLAISSGSISPAFSTSTLAYSASVENSVTSVTLTPTALDTTQTITLNNTTVVSGCGFCLPLSVGSNVAVITVSLSGGTSKTYTITVTRSAYSSVGLASLVLSSGSLSPAFSTSTLTYSASVENSVTKLYITATAADSSATVKVNSSTASPVSLTVGSNTITITVTSTDSTVTTYTLTVFRKYDAELTVSTQNASGAYCATVPDYISLLDNTDAFTFTLGGDTIVMPISTLKTYKGSDILTVSRSESSQSTVQTAAAVAVNNCTVAGGVNISLSGGSATTSCTLNAKVTLNFQSGIKTVLKKGVPEIYYYNTATGALVDTDAVFDMTADSVTFTAALSGTYVFATVLSDTSISYTVTASSNFSGTGDTRTFTAKITRGSDSLRLSDAKLLVVTTLSSGSQAIYLKELTGNDCEINVSVGKSAAHSAVYLIADTFDGKNIPTTYSLTQFVKA